MAAPTYSNTVKLGQYDRTMTGSAISLSATPLNVCKAEVRNRSGNAAVTLGFISTQLPISIAASAGYTIDVSAFEGMRFDLSLIFVNGTNTQLIDVMYLA